MSHQVLSELLEAIVRILEAMLEEVVVGNRNRAFGLVFTRLGAEEVQHSWWQVVAHGSKLQLMVASGGKGAAECAGAWLCSAGSNQNLSQ